MGGALAWNAFFYDQTHLKCLFRYVDFLHPFVYDVVAAHQFVEQPTVFMEIDAFFLCAPCDFLLHVFLGSFNGTKDVEVAVCIKAVVGFHLVAIFIHHFDVCKALFVEVDHEKDVVGSLALGSDADGFVACEML